MSTLRCRRDGAQGPAVPCLRRFPVQSQADAEMSADRDEVPAIALAGAFGGRALPPDEPKKERHELWQVLDKIQMDLRAAQAKLTEARSMLAGFDLPDPKTVTCPRCGLKRPGPRSLAEHMYTSHDGALPEHWGFEA